MFKIDLEKPSQKYKSRKYDKFKPFSYKDIQQRPLELKKTKKSFVLHSKSKLDLFWLYSFSDNFIDVKHNLSQNYL